MHQALEWVLLWHDFGRELLARDETFLATGLLILAHPALARHNITLLCSFTLSLLLLLHINLLHLMLISANFLVITHLLPIALLHLLLLLLLLFEEEHLLDLGLSQLLVDHLLLRREVILFDLLATTLDVQLLALSDSHFVFLCVHPLFIVALALGLMLHLGRSLHQEELLLLLLSKLLLVLTFFVLILATFILALTLTILVVIAVSLILTVQLGINQLLKLLLWDLESVRILVILFL